MTHYTYIYLREDGTAYYVGKGCGRRAFRKARRVRPPVNVDRILIQEFDCEDDALAAEIFLIAYYGRKDLGTGLLLNLTEGGDRAHRKNYVVSLAQREKISASLKRLGIAPKLSAQKQGGAAAGRLSKGKTWSAARRKHKVSDATRQLLSAARAGKPWSEARRRAQSGNG